jgi:hypothetical protein
VLITRLAVYRYIVAKVKPPLIYPQISLIKGGVFYREITMIAIL